MIARLTEWLWQQLARQLCRPRVVDWLITHSSESPYAHLQDPDGTYYMRRFWLLNRYSFGKGGTRKGWRRWFPSVRLHHIMRQDLDPHLHDHPWEARTVILRGSYREERLAGWEEQITGWPWEEQVQAHIRDYTEHHLRLPGDTCKLNLRMFHNIVSVSEGGVWTLFITWKYQGTWGFRVKGKKVPYREYLGPDNKYGRPLPKGKQP